MNVKNKPSILLIEDNNADADLVKLYLEEPSQKYDFYHVDSLYEGIQIIGAREIDITLLDLSLPDSSGFKTLSKYLEKAIHVPVVVLTGLNNEIIGNQAVKAGAQDFLVKGQFDSKLLGRVVRYSLQRFKTQQKLEETALTLSISEKRYEEAQRMAHFGNWQMDMVNNEMKWTDEVYRIFGIQPSSISPTLSDYLSFVHQDDKTKVENFVEEASKDGQQHALEHRIVINGTNIRHLAIQAKVCFEELTQKILLVGAMQDITERKLTEQLIIEKNINLRASKVKEEALANMSFHIRTPLSSIISLLFLLENTSASSAQKEYIEDLKTSIDDLSIMINNLLNMSVLVSENVRVEEEEFNIRDLLTTIKKIVQVKADNAKLRLEFIISDSLPERLFGDTRKIYQIIYNLIDNAIKFSNNGGRVTISAKVREKDNKKYLTLSVEDTGKGMTPTKVRALLDSEKILQIHNNDKDTSNKQLGVPIVTKLAKLMGGSLDISSKEGIGSTFLAEIPIETVNAAKHHSDETPEMPLKILLVEDHFLNQIATKKVLTTWSKLITVDIAENGLVGVEKFREHGYDIILMDLQMPVMTGFEATQIIRQKSNVPIIALTATSTKQEADRCLEMGFNDYLAKPFKPQELYAKILNLFVAVEN